jgi:hypothetical protein
MSRVRVKSKTKSTGTRKTGLPREICARVQEEVWRAVSEAARVEEHLSLSEQARRITDLFADQGVTCRDVTDALVFAAVDCDVPLLPRPVSGPPTIHVSGFLARIGTRRMLPGGARPSLAALSAPVAI